MMIDYSTSNLEKVAIRIKLETKQMEKIWSFRKIFWISPWETESDSDQILFNHSQIREYYSFTFSNDDFNLNPLFAYATTVFESKNHFTKNPYTLLRHLFEQGNNAMIKSGDLFVAYISEVVVEMR